MIHGIWERYRYRFLTGAVLLAVGLLLYFIVLPLGKNVTAYLGTAVSEVAAYKRTADRELPPDSLVNRYRELSARIAAFGSGKAKPSDVLQRILGVAATHKVLLQDMSTRDPISGPSWIEYPVNLRARGASNAVWAFLTELENGALCVSVASIQLSPTTTGVEAAIALSVFAPAGVTKP